MKFSKGIVIINVLICFILISCNSKEKKHNREKNVKRKKKSEIVIEKFSFRDTSKGKTNWILISDKAIIDNKNKIIDLKGVNIKYRKNYKITSKSGKYFIDKKIANLYDSVKIENDNITFITENLKFYSNENRIETDSKIKVLNEKFSLSANSLIGYIDKNKFILSGEVKSILK